MPRRLVPVLLVVTFLLAPLASVPAGAATAGPPATAASGDEATATARTPANDTSTVPGAGVVTDAASTPDGGAYLVGSSALRAANLTVTRLTPNGSVAWQRTIGGPNASLGGKAVVSSPTGVYVLAVAGPADPPRRGRPDRTVRLLHLTPRGTVEWRRSLGPAPRIGPARDLLATAGVGVVYAHPTRGEPQGVELRRIAPDGAVVWNRTYAGGEPRALAVAADGDYLIAGQHDYSEAWLLRVTADGAVAVNRTYGDINDRRVVGVVPTDDGGALLAGSAAVASPWGDPWVMRVDAAGVPRWSHTYPAERAHPQGAVPTDAGVLLVHASRPEGGTEVTRLTHVAADGSVGTRTRDMPGRTLTSRVAADGTVQLYGFDRDPETRSFTGTVATAPLPAPVGSPTAPGTHAGITSNATAYRGQNLRFDAAANVTYELYRLPSEYTEFDHPRLVRRLTTDAPGTVSFETATLPSGRYAVQTAGDYWLALEDGAGVGLTTTPERAAFTLEDQYLRVAYPDADRAHGPRFARPGANRTVVETFRGERGVRVRIDADRPAFTARVELTRLHADPVDADALSGALAADPQFRGMAASERRRGVPYGLVAMPTEGDRNVTLDAGALPPGLYRVSITPQDTADATEPATARVVVITEERPVTLTPANTSLTVPRGGEATTNLTLAGVDAGISALRLEAARTGPPATALRLEFTDAIRASSASGGAGIGPNRSTAEVQSMAVRHAPNGTFTVARLSTRTDRLPVGAETTGTNTVTLRLAWVIDADGVPYSLPEPVTIRYTVTNATATRSGGGDTSSRETGKTGTGSATG